MQCSVFKPVKIVGVQDVSLTPTQAAMGVCVSLVSVSRSPPAAQRTAVGLLSVPLCVKDVANRVLRMDVLRPLLRAVMAVPVRPVYARQIPRAVTWLGMHGVRRNARHAKEHVVSSAAMAR